MDSPNSNSRIIKVEKRSELRLVIKDQRYDVTLELVEGSAEVFGAELLLNKIYVFSKFYAFAVFTWRGCTIKLNGKINVKRIRKGVPDIYRHLSTLEDLRTKAKNENTFGPVTLLAGPTDVGKSTLCRFLLNCAARDGRQPIYIDLDVGQSSLSIPGTLGVLPVDRPSDIIQGFGELDLSVYYFGYKSPGLNISLYYLLIRKVGEALQNRLQHMKNHDRSSGVIIDTCGWVTGQGYRSIIHAAKVFQINLLFVIGDRKLYFKLKHDVSEQVEVVFVPKLCGVVERNKTVRTKTRDARVYEYFYGALNTLKPHSFKVRFSDLQIFKVGSCEKRPIDYENVNVEQFNLISIPISFELLYQVLALSYANRHEDVIITSTLPY